ncbi:MAG: response regulator transcription factor [Flavobacteriaceae bacterium]
MTKRVVLIEDNIPLRDAFEEIISSDKSFYVVNVYTSCEEALQNCREDRPDIILMDVELPGMNGVEGTKQFKKCLPNVNVIMVTVYENSEIVFDALCAGAIGYLTKSLTPIELMEALYECVQGGAPMSINIAKMVVGSFQRKPSKIELSKREKEVLHSLAQGNSYDLIAEKLFISKNTIKFHLKNIYLKLQVNSNIEAIQKANEENLL